MFGKILAGFGAIFAGACVISCTYCTGLNHGMQPEEKDGWITSVYRAMLKAEKD